MIDEYRRKLVLATWRKLRAKSFVTLLKAEVEQAYWIVRIELIKRER